MQSAKPISKKGILESSSHDYPPIFRMLCNKILHQLLTLGIFQIDDLNAVLFQEFFAAYESVVLAHDDAGDFVEDAGAGAHIAW